MISVCKVDASVVYVLYVLSHYVVREKKKKTGFYLSLSVILVFYARWWFSFAIFYIFCAGKRKLIKFAGKIRSIFCYFRFAYYSERNKETMSSDKEKVLNYLKSTHRPFNLNDIHQVHSDRTKAAIQKALDQLVCEQKIREKIYNKQKIYSILPNPDQNSGDTLKEVPEIELEILQKTESLKKLEEELKLAGKELIRFQSMPTLEEAEKQEVELRNSVNNLEMKLSSLSAGQVTVSKTDRESIIKKYDCIMKVYKKRKRICMDILDSILENYPKKKSLLMDEIGIELDDDKILSMNWHIA